MMKVSYTDQADAVAQRVSAAFQRRGSLDALYCNDVALEAMLMYATHSGKPAAADYVFEVLEKRSQKSGKPIEHPVPWKLQPFGHITYALYTFTHNEGFRDAFVAESEAYFAEGERGADGLMVHVCESKPQGAVLIDSMHDYCSRMIQAAALNGNAAMTADAVDQFERHYALLRYEDTALWRQGRGWLDDPQALSPGTWSRGQGWVVRGLVESCVVLDRNSDAYARVQVLLLALAEELITRQAADGMWHILPHRPVAESYGDCSGTGLILYNFALALKHGIITGQRYVDAIERAWIALSAHVDADGCIHHVSKGPGPLFSEDDYLDTEGVAEDGAGHGPFALLFACAGMHIMDGLAHKDSV